MVHAIFAAEENDAPLLKGYLCVARISKRRKVSAARGKTEDRKTAATIGG